MALLSGEVETGAIERPANGQPGTFRMALLSGEVETETTYADRVGKYQFRMALLSGEVETPHSRVLRALQCWFRMALLSGEVETAKRVGSGSIEGRSGWLCYPGKLKQRS